MHATPNNAAVSTVAIDLAKDVFELAFADPQARIVERARLPRSAFARVLDNRAPARGDGGVRVGALLGTALPGYDRRGGVRHAFDPRASAGVRRGRPAHPQRLQRAGGIGLITATALSASVGEFDRFPSGRHFASSLGLTPRVIPAAMSADSAASPNAATSTCACC